MTIQSYRDLEVWQTSMDLVVKIYERTREFSKHELYGLTSQMQRAAISVPANIAEGHGRRSTKEFIHFLSIANGSLVELETYAILAERLKYVSYDQSLELLNITSGIGRMIVNLQRRLKDRI